MYVLEPPTKGKVVVNTTHGPIDVELWPKEAPKSVRNFVQLCLEGYFDNTIFHRVIPGFLVQGGDPTGSGTGNFYVLNYFLGFKSLVCICKLLGLKCSCQFLLIARWIRSIDFNE